MNRRIALLLIVFASAFGAQAPTAGTVELAGMGGLNLGLSGSGGPTVAADMQGYINRWFSIGAGAGWVPMRNESLGYSYRGTSSLYSYDGGAQFHMANASRITPYLAIGAGGLRESRQITNAGVKEWSGSMNVFALNLGGGFRASLARRMGVRFQAEAIKGRNTRLFGRVLIGVYGRFGGGGN